jgi:hypothetical protein
MRAANLKKRTLADLGYPVAAGVLRTIQLLQERYGASDYHDSGHTNTAPTWIFKLPRYGNAEVGVRMNKRDTTLYMRDRTCNGMRLRDLIPAGKVAKVYPSDGKPAASVLNSVYLGPSTSNEVLMLELEPDDVNLVLSAFFGEGHENSGVSAAVGVSTGADKTVADRGMRAGLTEEEFASLLERRSETGRAGEMLVILEELARLRACGCPRPEDYVKRVAESDVGCGYDVASTWPGEERYIEVKTTTCPGSDFFLTANERAVLEKLGKQAWLYRVAMEGKIKGRIIARLNDPMKAITKESMTAVVWRVSAGVCLMQADSMMRSNEEQ